MRIPAALLAACALLLATPFAGAQGADLTGTGGTEAATAEDGATAAESGAADDLFSDAPDDVETDEPTGSVLEDLEQGRKLAWSGSIVARAGVMAGWIDPPWSDGGMAGESATPLGAFGSTLAFDVRPNSYARVHGAFSVDYPEFLPAVAELFFDYDLEGLVYARFGRQTLSWGAGRFYRDANLVAGAEEGVALKATVPLGALNLQGVVVDRPAWHPGSDVPDAGQLGYGGLLDFAVGKVEASAGGFYRGAAGATYAATVKTSLAGVDLYADGVAKVARETSWAAVAGFYWDRVDPSVRLAGEYRFATGDFGAPWHAATLAALFRRFLGSPWNLGVRWDHDFLGMSGQVMPGLTWTPWKRVTVALAAPVAYGGAVVEYEDETDASSRTAAVVLAVSVNIEF